MVFQTVRTFMRAGAAQWQRGAVLVVATGTMGVGAATALHYQRQAVIANDEKKPADATIKGDPEMRQKMEELIRRKQREIVAAMEKLEGPEGKKFLLDEWERPNGKGVGISAVLQDGRVIEKGGTNITIMEGVIPPAGVKKMKADHQSLNAVDPDGNVPFWVCGLSMIMHPRNPMAPTVHLNYRYFETQNADGSPAAWWFGGGADLTPHYLFPEDAIEFHQCLKDACDNHSPTYYKRFKKWCDKYFWNTHRKESRGVGGIFFDDLTDQDPQELYGLASDCFDAFLKSYPNIMQRRMNMPFTEQQKEWQLLRRGRYVEFNLVHDRGTAFGLHTPDARIESILVSLPLHASWRYMHTPQPGSDEEQLVEVLQNPKDWIPLE